MGAQIPAEGAVFVTELALCGSDIGYSCFRFSVASGGDGFEGILWGSIMNEEGMNLVSVEAKRGYDMF